MANRRTAIMVVPPERAKGIADGTVDMILSRRDFTKVGMPFFIITKESMSATLYLKLGDRIILNYLDYDRARNSGLTPEEFREWCKKGEIYAYPIRELVRLDDPIPLSRFNIGTPHNFAYSEVTLKEVLS